MVNQTYKDKFPHPCHYDELKFLRFFYQEAQNGMGPASDDIYWMIKDAWTDAGNALPEGYGVEDE